MLPPSRESSGSGRSAPARGKRGELPLHVLGVASGALKFAVGIADAPQHLKCLPTFLALVFVNRHGSLTRINAKPAGLLQVSVAGTRTRLFERVEMRGDRMGRLS